ncbi:MAG: hypothetical protein HZB38_01910 [Planctomycetes bacterium]|nr:hypothetical protein [Planctomycetota bacterium]
MDRVKVTVERTDSDGRTRALDTFVYELPMSAEQTASVGQAVTDKLEKLSAAAAIQGGR